MSAYRQNVGRKGEQLIAQTLINRNFRIIGMNVTTRWSEIDIVAYHNHIIHCVEVKTRSSSLFGDADEALTKQKFLKLCKATIIVQKRLYPFICGRVHIDFAAVTLRREQPPKIIMRWNIGPSDFE